MYSFFYFCKGSQDASIKTFGLGKRKFARVEVLFPGGHRTLLFPARSGDNLLVPEIPCSVDNFEQSKDFDRCVRSNLRQLVRKGIIDRRMSARLRISMNLLWKESH